MPQQATVFNPTTGERKAVTVGDPNAFAGGFKLETPTDKFQAPQTPTGLSKLPTQSPIPPGPSQTTPGMAPQPQGSQSAFQAAYAQLLSKGQQNQDLQSKKNLLLLQLYDRQLMPEELQTLSPSQQEAIRSGNKQLLEYQVMTLNDTIKGRADENSKALEYMMDGYKQDVAMAEQRKQQAQNTMFTLIDKYGGAAGLAPERVQAILNGEMPTPEDVIALSGAVKSQKSALMEISPGATVFDPSTGKALYTAPSKGSGGGGTSGGGGGGGYGVVSGGASNKDLTDDFNIVFPRIGSVNAQKAAQATFSGYLKSGDLEGARRYVDSIAYDGMTGVQKKDVDIFRDVSAMSSSVVSRLDQFARTNPGFYRDAIEMAKPFVALKKDRNYAGFMQEIELVQSQMRNALFGAALSPQEAKLAERFLITERDDIGIIKTKLDGLKKFTDEAVRRRFNTTLNKHETESGQKVQMRPDEPNLSLTQLGEKYGVSRDEIQMAIKAGHTAAQVRQAILMQES